MRPTSHLLALVALLAEHLSEASPLKRENLITKRDTSKTQRPELGSVAYGLDIRRCTEPGKIALTFDDGPWRYTSQLLDLLDKNQDVKATFFVVGNNAEHGRIDDPKTKYPKILRRMHEAGHQIGSHTWTHADLQKLDTAGRREEILKNEEAFASILGFFPTYLRPPYTDCREDCIADLGALGYHVANYDVDTKDYEGDYDYARRMFQGNVTEGESPTDTSHIVLSHDIREETVHEFAQFMIDGARDAGFQLVTMGDCLGDPVENWYRDAETGKSWK